MDDGEIIAFIIICIVSIGFSIFLAGFILFPIFVRNILRIQKNLLEKVHVADRSTPHAKKGGKI